MSKFKIESPGVLAIYKWEDAWEAFVTAVAEGYSLVGEELRKEFFPTLNEVRESVDRANARATERGWRHGVRQVNLPELFDGVSKEGWIVSYTSCSGTVIQLQHYDGTSYTLTIDRASEEVTGEPGSLIPCDAWYYRWVAALIKLDPEYTLPPLP